MHTCRRFFMMLVRVCCADVCRRDHSQEQQSPTNPPPSTQYLISTNSTLSHKDGGGVGGNRREKKKKKNLKSPSTFSQPRNILNSKFCTYELHDQILCLWVTYCYIQNTDHLLRSSTLIRNRAELNLTVLSSIFKDQNKSLRSTHILNDQVFHHSTVILCSHHFV